jgi:hypothetical protein
MGEVVSLFDKDAVYHGTCLRCNTSWRVTKEQLDVALESGILYSPCCEQPATIVKVRSSVKKTNQSPPHL